MGLCGGFRCGCGLTSTPASSGAINGELPTINVSGSGEPGDPYDINLNDDWSAQVASGIIRPRIGMNWGRQYFQSIPNNSTTTIVPDIGYQGGGGFSATTPVVIPAGQGGVYLITGLIRYPSTALGNHLMGFLFNSDGSKFYPFAGGLSGHQAGSLAVMLRDGDTVEVQTRHNNGSAMNVTARFEIYRLPDAPGFWIHP